MNSKTLQFLSAKLHQLEQRKFVALYLGDEAKQEVEIKDQADMMKFARYMSMEAANILHGNRREKNIAVAMIVSLFIIGLVIVLCRFLIWGESAVTSSGVIVALGISIHWPIKKLLEIRESDMQLQFSTLIMPYLPPEKAAELLKEVLTGKKGGKKNELAKQ